MDHDRLFKELLTEFFAEFLELFFPSLVQYLDRESLTFMDKEVFTDITLGERHEVDLLAKAQVRDQSSFFLVHVETQAQPQGEFARRMFHYFTRLHQKHGLQVYPVAVFSYDQPLREEPNEYRVAFPDFDVLSFHFRVVQLNRLDWHAFVERTNPIAAALMARMQMQPNERPAVKLACLELLAQLQLDPARRALISGFVDSYLRLTMDEEQEFREELNKVAPQRQEQVMEIVTSWMERGIEQGMEEGLKQGRQTLVMRQLRKRLGDLDPEIESQIGQLSVDELDTLAEALLDFEKPSDLHAWLAQRPAAD